MKKYKLPSGNMTVAEMQTLYKKVSKVVDERLRQLERKGKTKYAYQVALRNTKALGRKDFEPPRFERKLTGNVKDMRKKLNLLFEVYEKPSSTLRGLRQITQKAADSLNKHYDGLNIDSKNLGTFFESDAYKDLINKGYSSDTIVRGIAKMRRDKEKIQKKLDDHVKYHVHGNYQNAAVRGFIESRLQEANFNLDDFFSGFGF